MENRDPRDPLSLPGTAARILARVRLLARRRIAWLRRIWSEEGAGAARGVITHGEVDACLEGRDSPEAEAAWNAQDEEARALAAQAAGIASVEGQDDDSRLTHLARTFGLDEHESDLLQACAAIAIDPALGRLYAYLADHGGRSYTTEELVARLFGRRYRRVLTPESALRRWDLVHVVPIAPGELDALVCDPLARDWLLGDPRLDEPLVGVARLVPRREPLPSWPVEATAARIHRIVTADAPGRALMHVLGAPGSGRRTFAAAVAERLGLPLLAVDADRVSDEDWPRVHLRAQRQAYLDGCALAWVGDSLARRRVPEVVLPFPVQFVIAEPGDAVAPAPDTVAMSVGVPPPALAERRALWRGRVPSAATWSDDELDRLAGRNHTSLADIEQVARRGPVAAAEAAEVVREASRHRLGDLARQIECPFGWDDLILPAPLRRSLDELVFEARERTAFWEEPAARRLFPQGRGLFALFTGPPGTGKTMSAQVIAASLGVDLFRISLASVVSKYVGETAKNLQRILARAEDMDCVLLFDEADALFSKRTEVKDAHDRFANTDTNYLLQAIEAYRGIAVLATNKKSNIDSAFMRRLRYVLDFPRPDGPDRRRLWGRLVAELAGADRERALRAELDLVAQTVEVTGAQIKFAVLAALFAAREARAPLALEHVLRGLERELAKEGRAFDDRDRERFRPKEGAA